jgi:class 3 adenylate cyclase
MTLRRPARTLGTHPVRCCHGGGCVGTDLGRELLSLSAGLRPANVTPPIGGEVSAAAPEAPESAGRPNTGPDADRGALRRGSLRFLDERMERRYQRKAGAESLAGYRVTTGTAAVMWLLATLVIPTGTPIPLDRAMLVCCLMALLNSAAFLVSDWADTLDRQHSIVSVLTTANGLIIIWLASTGGVLPGYGISAVMLLFAFGFVARTGFIFAAWRTAVIVVGFVVAAIFYPGQGNLLVDTFIFGAAVIGTLLALRLLEQSRRRVFYQDTVITEQADALRLERDRADALLLNVLPGSISSRLLAGERTIADEYPAVTVLFADIVGFTPLAARLPAREVVEILGRLFARFDELVAARGLEKIKTIGDAYMVAGGLPQPLPDHAARVVDLGLAMIEVAAQEGGRLADLRLRVGVHSGPVVGGVIGHRKFAFDIWGETVNIASRLESQGVSGRVRVSAATWREVRDLFDAESHGPIYLRGYGPLDAYTIAGRRRAGSQNPRGGPVRVRQNAVTSLERTPRAASTPLAKPAGV